MKTCLVVPFYFAARRIRSNYQTFKGSSDVIELAEACYENYLRWDSGCDTDIIFVNNSPEVKEASRFLDKINGSKVKNGKLIVINGDNIGMGFGAHSLAYKTFKDKYDYWMFTEDDTLITKKNLMKIAIEQLKSNSNLGFVACYGLALGSRKHAHGGIGCTSKENLEKVWAKHGKLPHHESIPDLTDNKKFKHTHIMHGEIAFTNCYAKLGMEIEKVACDGVPYARWDRDESPINDKRDKDIWGEIALCHKQCKEEILDDGYVVIKDFLSAEDCKRIKSEFLNLLEKFDLSKTKDYPELKVVNHTKKREVSGNLGNLSEPVLLTRGLQGFDENMIELFKAEKLINLPTQKIREHIDQLALWTNLSKYRVSFSIYYNKGVTNTRGYHRDNSPLPVPGNPRETKRLYKFFMYITDVSSIDQGPYSYIPGTHTWDNCEEYSKQLQPISQNDLDLSLDPKIFLEKAGTVLITDQAGFHRGLPQNEKSERLMLVCKIRQDNG